MGALQQMTFYFTKLVITKIFFTLLVCIIDYIVLHNKIVYIYDFVKTDQFCVFFIQPGC